MGDPSGQGARCERCAELEAELLAVRRERDEALLQLSQERERLDALRLQRGDGEVDLSAVAGAPLRYVLADQLNDSVKRVLSPLHRSARGAIAWLAKRR